MDLHMMGEVPTDFDVSAFERDALARINMPREIIMRHRPPHFGHIVGGYAAGYYGSLWAEVIDADAFEAFEETGDPFNPELAARFRDYIFAAGNLREPMEAYVLFRGREPDPAALLRARGFAPPRN
jgi:peptidyl-dipeptidase Dcp